MENIRKSAVAQSTKPDIDDTLADILQGYFFLSDQRNMAVGMGGAISLPIPITEMLSYCSVFMPTVSRKHFIRVVRAADNEYTRLQAETHARKNKQGSSGSSGSGSTFPAIPTK